MGLYFNLNLMLFLLIPETCSCVASLRYFETLSNVFATSRTARSSQGVKTVFKRVTFSAFSRRFDLTLKSGTDVLTRDFRARVIHSDGSATSVDVDQSQIFTGHLSDRDDVKVYAHLEESLWLIKIFDSKDVYVLEPAWRLLSPSENPKNHTLIAYRSSDLISLDSHRKHFCGVPDNQSYAAHLNSTRRKILNPFFSNFTRTRHGAYGQEKTTGAGRRVNTRNAESKTIHGVCTLFLIADYTFFSKFCNSNYKACSTLLISLVYLANEIFSKAQLGDYPDSHYKLIGLQVKEMLFFSSFTTHMKLYGFEHFNENVQWNANSKLDAFGKYVRFLPKPREICSYHLFTSTAFPGEVIGLSYLGDLCPGSFCIGYCESHNIGFTSGKSHSEGQIPTLKMNLVFVHELGHNFGSEHDPQTKECSSHDNKGGNYIMWPRAVTGFHPNHYKFSPCSLRGIREVLTTKTCITDRSKQIFFCGDSIVNKGEACDAGAYGMLNGDPCCSNQCQLRTGAICSDQSHGCCSNCSVSPAHTLCLAEHPYTCQEASYCDGRSLECPEPKSLPDWTECQARGQCYGGVCRSFCEIKSIKMEGDTRLTECMCESADEACMLCCFNDTDPHQPGPCQMHSKVLYPDGTPCFIGFCKAGVCHPGGVSIVQRVYNFLPEMKVSKIAEFVKSNIVMTVVVISLCFWLPLVFWISRTDNYQKKKIQKIGVLIIRENNGDDEVMVEDSGASSIVSVQQPNISPTSETEQSSSLSPIVIPPHFFDMQQQEESSFRKIFTKEPVDNVSTASSSSNY